MEENRNKRKEPLWLLIEKQIQKYKEKGFFRSKQADNFTENRRRTG
jgi:hypothetical protein